MFLYFDYFVRHCVEYWIHWEAARVKSPQKTFLYHVVIVVSVLFKDFLYHLHDLQTSYLTQL